MSHERVERIIVIDRAQYMEMGFSSTDAILDLHGESGLNRCNIELGKVVRDTHTRLPPAYRSNFAWPREGK